MATLVVNVTPMTTVNMGEIALVAGDEKAQAILGSCLGLCIQDTKRKLGALAHVVLPLREGRSGPPGKFIDSAIPWMIQSLRSRGADPAALVCKLTGGANMFAGNGPFQIGQQNIAVAKRELASANIRVIGEHLEGMQGRRVTFDAASGNVRVEVAGCTAVVL
jgi:chemotaxis protein CheD